MIELYILLLFMIVVAVIAGLVVMFMRLGRR